MIFLALAITCLASITSGSNLNYGSTQIQNPLTYSSNYPNYGQEITFPKLSYNDQSEYKGIKASVVSSRENLEHRKNDSRNQYVYQPEEYIESKERRVIFPGENLDGENNFIPKIELRAGLLEHFEQTSTERQVPKIVDYVKYQLPEPIQTTTTTEVATKSNRKLKKGRNNRRRKDRDGSNKEENREARKRRKNRRNKRKNDDNLKKCDVGIEGGDERKCKRRKNRRREHEENDGHKSSKRRQHNQHGGKKEKKRKRGSDHHHHHEHLHHS